MLPPQAKRIPHILELHGHQRNDPYYWLNQRDNPEVIAYLEAENAYTREMMAPAEALQQELFEEMKGRIKEEDSSVPYWLDGSYYYHRYEKGHEYPVYARREGSLEAAEEIILDVNTLAESLDYCVVKGGDRVSPDHRYLAYALDSIGRRIYTLHFKDLKTGKTFPEAIPGVSGNAVWAADSQTLFYTRLDPQTLRAFQVYRHRLGTDPVYDELVFEEKDEAFYVYLYRTQSRQFLMIDTASTLANEILYLESAHPDGTFRVFSPREKVHEYFADHLGDYFYLRTNWEAKNFRLMRTPVAHTSKSHWEELAPHREDTLLEGIALFHNFLVLEERKEGLNTLRVVRMGDDREKILKLGEAAYSVHLGKNPDPATPWLRYAYQSLTTPPSVLDFNMETGEHVLRKETPVLGGFDKHHYQAERIMATAPDGVQVPISLVYRKDTPLDGSAPLLLFAYGAYGFSMDPYFNSNRLSLLDRGFIFALAHVRGGEDLGREWYEAGKMLRKMNTFTDYIACAEHLIAQHYCSSARLYAMGGSAGGLLVGAVLNMRPELFHGAVAAVPFVDVLTTMLDERIPLTTGEFHEWGDPRHPQFYDYLLSYSPYDNVKAQDYPHLLVTAGLHDSQVQYWEPAKWVAKLRHLKTDNNRLLLHTHMEAGHTGASGRFEALKEVAMEYAFLLVTESRK